jgi:hypothetical protein
MKLTSGQYSKGHRIAEVQLINEAGNVMESKDGDTCQFLKVNLFGSGFVIMVQEGSPGVLKT